MNSRFKEIRQIKNLTQSELGKIIGLSQNHISALEKGERNITDRIIKELNAALNVNPNWIRYGEGEMFNSINEVDKSNTELSQKIEFKERLKKYRESLNLNKRDFSRKLDVNENSYYMIEAGTRGPSKKFLENLVLYSRKPEEFWLYGVQTDIKISDGFQISISEKLKDFRTKKLMTQVEFARTYKLPRITITELESGRKEPTLKMIYKIAEATNTELSYWLEPNKNSKHSDFKCLDETILKLLKNEMIDKEGNLSEEAKEIILNIIEIEIKLSYL